MLYHNKTKRFSGCGITILYNCTSILLVCSDISCHVLYVTTKFHCHVYIHELSQYYCSAQVKTSMMANVSDCEELHNELWKLSDIDEVY